MSARILLLAILLLSAAGCGQKGPLYLPDEGDSQDTEQGG
jgi:predicted small lipoprotein YifL